MCTLAPAASASARYVARHPCLFAWQRRIHSRVRSLMRAQIEAEHAWRSPSVLQPAETAAVSRMFIAAPRAGYPSFFAPSSSAAFGPLWTTSSAGVTANRSSTWREQTVRNGVHVARRRGVRGVHVARVASTREAQSPTGSRRRRFSNRRRTGRARPPPTRGG